MSAKPLPFAMTGSTATRTVGADIKISATVGVTLRTMGDLSHSGCGGLSRFATSNILSLRDRFQVRRIYARTNAAKMIQLQFRRNGADGQFVSNAMGEFVFPFYSHITVSGVVHRAQPCPTPAFWYWYGIGEHCLNAGVLHYDGIRRIAPQVTFLGANDTPVIPGVSLANVAPTTRGSREKSISVDANSFPARDNRAVVWDVNKSHEIGSFDQVVRDRKALKHLVVPTYTAIVI